MKWTAAFFSQTGSEILNIINATGVVPEVIISNRLRDDGTIRNIGMVNKELLDRFESRIIYIPNRPSVEDYKRVLGNSEKGLISLHGYLRILPPEICDSYEVVNLHPGLITKYPFLKGKDPQEKAYGLQLDTSGAVIHKVTAEVDSGEILDSVEIPIKGLSLDEVYENLHKCSSELWIKFFKEHIL